MVYWYRGVPFKELPFIDSNTVEHWVIMDDSPIGEPEKYAVIAKRSDGKIICVEEVDAGFHTNDKLLQRYVDGYFRTKNLNEFLDLDELNNKEMNLGIELPL